MNKSQKIIKTGSKLVKTFMDAPENSKRDRIRQFIKRNNRLLQPLMFLSGFMYDSLTMIRVDSILDNLIFGFYLLILGFILWIQLRQVSGQALDWPWLEKTEDFHPLITQFLFGGLFSGYIIFYFQSAADVKGFLFILALALLLIGNEFFEKKYQSAVFFYSMFYFALFSYLLFLLPSLLRQSNTGIFYLAIILSLFILIVLVQGAKNQLNTDHFKLLYKEIYVWIAGTIAILMIVGYHTNIIPPVPLSMKDMGIYKDFERKGNDYHFYYQEPHWTDSFRDYNKTIYWKKGDKIYSFASVFAPGNVEKKLTHHWEWFDEIEEEWVVFDTISYVISGGRAAGWRGYTYKRKMKQGDWRVQVKTEENKLIGRTYFEVIFLDSLHKNTREVVY